MDRSDRMPLTRRYAVSAAFRIVDTTVSGYNCGWVFWILLTAAFSK